MTHIPFKPYFYCVMEFFLAKRFYKSGGTSHRASSPAIRIAIFGIAIGLCVMILTQAVVSGFQREVTEKVTGMASHIEIMDIRTLGSPESFPITIKKPFQEEIINTPHVKHIQRIATKMGILKTNQEFMAIQLKGFGSDYDSTFLKKNIKEGRLPKDNEVLISSTEADLLNLKVGDKVFAYFFEEDIRMRRFSVCGIYETHMTLFDKSVAFSTFTTVAALNPWGVADTQACNILEVHLDQKENIAATQEHLKPIVSKHTDNAAQPVSIEEHYPQVFSWLNLLDSNMIIIMVLMVCVAGFTMISGLLILILERTQAIGILKALGATSIQLRKTFLIFAALIVIRGMIIGNILGLGLILIQQKWGIVHLDPSTYYVDTVPADLNWGPMFIINISTLAITMLALILPSLLVSRIQPAKAIRFE